MKHCLVATLLSLPVAAHAHTFLIKPEQRAGEQLPVSVLMTEKLFVGERLLEPATVALRLLTGENAQGIELLADNEAKVLRGLVAMPARCAVLAAKTAPRYRAIEKGQQTEDPAKMLRIEAFAKAFVSPGARCDSFAQRSGDRLELIPQNDPGTLAAGGELVLLALFDGKPITGKVVAMAPGQPRIVVETDDRGIAHLPLPEAGDWVVRTSRHNDERDDRSARYEASASLFLRVD